MALDLFQVFNGGAFTKLKKATTKVITWVKKNPLKALGLAAIGLAGVAAIFFLGPLFVAGVGAFLSAGLLVKIGVLLTLSALFSFAIGIYQVAYTFNWLKSDKEIDNEIKRAYDSLYGMTGELLGQSLGYLIVGGVAGATTFAMNKHMCAAIFENLREEAQEELMGQLAALSRATFQSWARVIIARQFKSARRYLKKRPDHPFSQYLIKKMGKKGFAEWGKTEGQNFTISGKVDEKVENIKDPNLQNFAESFLEGLGEAITNGGYVGIQSAETFMATQAMMNRRAAGLDPNENVVVATVS